MDGFLLYMFLGLFLALSLLSYANLLVLQYFNLRFRSVDGDKQASLQQTLLVVSVSCLWYFISLSFTLYNKWILQQWRHGFNFPMIFTAIHMILKYIITRIWVSTSCAPKIERISARILFGVVIPIGICTSADVVFSNAAIYYLPLSMFTVIKGSTLIFTFIFGVMLELEMYSYQLLLAVSAIVVGLGMAILTSAVTLNTFGIICALFSAAAGGLRWAMMQLLAVRDPQSSQSMVTLYRFSPYAALSILPFALLIEVPVLLKSDFVTASDSTQYLLLEALGFLSFGGLISFCLIVVEIVLLRITSSLTMSVIGQLKEMLQILAGMLFYADNISMRSGVGITVSILGAYYYRHISMNTDSHPNSDDEYDANDELQATIQILQSSDIAHRNLIHSEIASGYGIEPNESERGEHDLLLEQEMIQLSSERID